MDLEAKPGEIVTDGKSVVIGAPVVKAVAVKEQEQEQEQPRLDWRETQETSTWP